MIKVLVGQRRTGKSYILRQIIFHLINNKNKNTEIDFVAEKNHTKIYVQVSYLLENQKTIQREFGNLEAIKDYYEKIVISMDDLKLTNYKGIKHLRPWELK